MTKTRSEKFREDINTLNELGIVYFSCTLQGDVNDDGSFRFDPDYPDRLKKKFIPPKGLKYRGIKIKTMYNPDYNATAIVLGKRYNLIGIDVDTKENTLKKYLKILKDNDVDDTFTVKTCNSGFHYYYYLDDCQQNILEFLDFKSKNNALFGLHIDVKYTDQIFFGPSTWVSDKPYQYYIYKDCKPIQIPDFLFDELINNIPEDNEVIEKKSKKEKKTSTNEKIPNIKYINCYTCEKDIPDYPTINVGRSDLWGLGYDKFICNVCSNKINTDYCTEKDLGNGQSIAVLDENFKAKIMSNPDHLSNVDEFIKSIVNKIKEHDNDKTKKVTKGKKNTKTNDNNELDDDESENYDSPDAMRLRLYLDCLKCERWDNYEQWFRLGSIIYTENGTLDLFKEYSMKSKKYNEQECNKKWNEYSKNKGRSFTISKLMEMAKFDDIKQFKLAQEQDAERILSVIVNNGITDVSAAKVFYTKNQDSYLYDQSQDKLYSLNEFNYWFEDAKAYDLKDHINKELPKIIEAVYFKKYNQIPDGGKYMKLKAGLTSTHHFNLKFLSSNKNKAGIIDELKTLYRKRDIFEKLDNVNDYLFAFNNGVFDFTENKFRKALPDELITFTCGYDYSNEVEEDIKYLDDLIMTMFETIEDKDYILTCLGINLVGAGKPEVFFIWIGKGRNGKGVIRDLVMHTFGKYFDAVNVEYLYKAKKNSGSDVKSADSILAKKKNVRIIMTTEPESGCQLNTQKAKEWSGKDPIQCRDLYGKTFNFIAKFHLFIQSNFEISFKGSNGKAVGERVKVLEFPYCFIENPVYEYEKLINFDLKEEIKDPKYFIAFFHLLKRYYFKWINNNKIIVMPPNVKEQTELMKISNDDITPFFDAIVIKVNDTSCYVKKTDLFQAFRRFYLGDSKNVTPSDFTAGMLDKGLKLSVLKGYQIFRNVKLNEEKLKQIEEEELKKTNPDLCFR